MEIEKITLSELYKIIETPNAWNFYSIDYVGLNVDILTNSEMSRNFILKFLGGGEKLTYKFNNFIEKLSNKKTIHIVSTFFLGISIYNNQDKIRLAINSHLNNLKLNVEANNSQKFTYLWFLITLFHDLGYAIEEDSIIDFQNSDSIFLNKKPGSIPKIYNIRNIENYRKYRLCRWAVKDHGIYGAKVFYHEMCKQRQEKEKDSSTRHYWGKELENIYILAAWTIMCHNMYFIRNDDPNISFYKALKLNNFIYNKRKRGSILKSV
jgi:hypothetical protein